MMSAWAGMVCGLLMLAQTCAAADKTITITGAGSSAAAPIYESWAREYQKTSGVSLVYEPAGSSAGLKKIRARETDFGATDLAPSEAELAADGLVLFPTAITGIAPIVNLSKVGNGQLRLTGDVLARIFLGEIIRWSAPEIVQLNPGINLPDLAIRVVVRSDGSGTTYNFADYLAKVSPEWRGKNGVKTSYAWPADFLAVKGSHGVVTTVKETAGAIGYVDFGYVKDNQLSPVQLKNLDGEFLKPSIPAFRGALTHSDWVSKGVFTTTLTQKPGRGTWPITMGTFIVLPRIADKPEQAQHTLKFFIWAFMNGDAQVQEMNFVRLPDRVQAAAFKAITSVRNPAGNLMIDMSLLSNSTPAR
jgi:phosphate transport system substrate-binding protein